MPQHPPEVGDERGLPLLAQLRHGPIGAPHRVGAQRGPEVAAIARREVARRADLRPELLRDPLRGELAVVVVGRQQVDPLVEREGAFELLRHLQPVARRRTDHVRRVGCQRDHVVVRLARILALLLERAGELEPELAALRMALESGARLRRSRAPIGVARRLAERRELARHLGARLGIGDELHHLEVGRVERVIAARPARLLRDRDGELLVAGLEVELHELEAGSRPAEVLRRPALARRREARLEIDSGRRRRRVARRRALLPHRDGREAEGTRDQQRQPAVREAGGLADAPREAPDRSHRGLRLGIPLTSGSRSRAIVCGEPRRVARAKLSAARRVRLAARSRRPRPRRCASPRAARRRPRAGRSAPPHRARHAGR